MRANVTLTLDDDLLREARILAARLGTSLSRLLAEQLEKLVRDDRDYEEAKQSAMARMERGYDLGWKKPASRDELYERD